MAAAAIPAWQTQLAQRMGMDPLQLSQLGNLPVSSQAALTPPGAAPDPNAALIPPGASPAPSIPNFNSDMGVMNNITTGQNLTVGGAQQINQEAAGQLNYNAALEGAAQQKEQAALDQLQQTPGYTAPEAAQINVNYGQYRTSPGDFQKQFLTPEEQAKITGDPNGAQNVMTQGTSAEGAQLNAFGANLGGQVQNLASDVGGNEQALQSGVGGQLSNYSTDLSGANQNLENWVNAPANNPALQFDPNKTEKQLTDADVQEMKTAAGTRIGNQYRTAEDTLERNAAAAGNTSPLALAAANARLQSQEASDQGDAETNADIAARQAQYQRAAGIEAQRLGATQTEAGMQEQAATTAGLADVNSARALGETGVSAAEMVGQSGVNAAENVGAQSVGAAENYGSQALNEAATAASQNYGAALTADQLAAQRAAALATNRQATQGNVNAATYQQGMQTGQATAQGATNVGQTRIAGQGAYRAGEAEQQGLAKQGVQGAIGAQNQALSTQTSGLTGGGSNATRDQGQNQQNMLGMFQTGLSLLGGGGEKGRIVTEPTVMTVGEGNKPEMVVPLGKYRSHEGKAA